MLCIQRSRYFFCSAMILWISRPFHYTVIFVSSFPALFSPSTPSWRAARNAITIVVWMNNQAPSRRAPIIQFLFNRLLHAAKAGTRENKRPALLASETLPISLHLPFFPLFDFPFLFYIFRDNRIFSLPLLANVFTDHFIFLILLAFYRLTK